MYHSMHTPFVAGPFVYSTSFVLQSLLLRHTLDVMHIEQNVCLSMLGYLLGEKDTIAMRKDMEEASSHHRLHLRRVGTSSVFFKPQAPYVLKDIEKFRFLENLASTKVPTSYSSSLGKLRREGQWSNLKSHDYHILLEHLIPAAIRSFLPLGPRDAVIRMGHVFQQLCSKVVKPLDMDALQKYVAETLCMFEIWFPPSFFDISVHLIQHLPRELGILGPVHSRWMYGVERSLAVLKRHVRTRARPEAAIANAYMQEESLGFATEYFANYLHTEKRVWITEADERDAGEVLQGRPKARNLSVDEILKLHSYVLENSVAVAPLLE
jgi:hypothetical protein